MLYNGKYDPKSKDAYKLSRSKVELFLNCPRCFYIDRCFLIRRPPSYPYTLNAAVDTLLKNEFDYFREKKTSHPYIQKIGINAIPFQHKMLEKWRQNSIGVSYLHKETNFHLYGAVDDIWIDLDTNKLILVDYKSTSKRGNLNLNAKWQDSYKRQIEFYQYLLRKNGFLVSSTAYFIYCNGIKHNMKFNERLNFTVECITYEGSDTWIDETIFDIHDLINNSRVPAKSESCNYCTFFDNIKLLNLE